MKTSHPLLLTIAVVFLLGGCSTTNQSTPRVASNFINRQQVTPATNDIYPSKNPQTVAVYTDTHKPHAAYRVIGTASVSKYNLLGMKRQDATVQEMMKNLAASIGGDGLIDVKTNDESMQARVIAFQKILI
ncbi:MAG: hypothetical protein EPO11_03995 [Gammaproteobacteria bacterium]|nr:MAG: hypothetical protein EPO11_03995 [Gammaproteobacteria bacterium]